MTENEIGDSDDELAC